MQIFVIIWLILFFWIIGKGIAQFIENENSPVLTGPATVVDMRKKKHLRAHYRSYPVTFQVESGEQIELRVKHNEYNELSIGDRGTLTHQGTRYQGFERII